MEMKTFFQKHADTLTILGVMGAIFLWTDSKFDRVHEDLKEIRNDMTTIKTVLILKGIMPDSFAKENK